MESSPNCSAGVFNNPPSVADFFHSFRHLNGRFHEVSSIFVPTFRDYQQALRLYAIGTWVFGGLVFLILCVYYVTSCWFCYKLHRPREKCAVALRRIVLLTCVLLSGSVIAGFVFNGSVRQGVRGVMTAVSNVNNTLVDTQAKINSIKDNLVDLDRNLGELKSCAKVTHYYRFIIHNLQGFVDDIIGLVARIKKVDLPPFEEYVQEKENYRGMIFGFLSVLFIWFSVGVDLALSVAMSDLCEQPKETLYHYIKDQPALKVIVRYYIECPIHERGRDQKYAYKAESILKVAIDAFSVLNKLKLPQDCREKVEKCHTDLTKTKTNMVGIIKNLDCKYPHQEFKSANCFVCEGVVNGIASLFLTSLIIGIFVVVILSLVLSIYLRSDSPIEPSYQPISDDDNPQESASLIPSPPMPTTCNSINRQASDESHSFEESGVPLLTPNNWLPTPGSSALVNPASSQ